MVQKETREARPRGRPRSFDPDAVLDRVRAVFWNLGYAATSLDDLVGATGLNRPSLYGAFGDKHALYMAALKRSRDEALGGIAAVLAQEAPLRQVLAGFYPRAIAVYQRGDEGQRGCFLIGTAVTQSLEDPAARETLAGFLAEADRLFLERFRRSADELAPGLTPEAAAPLAAATLHTLAIRARAGVDGEELRRIGQAAVTMICGSDSATK